MGATARDFVGAVAREVALGELREPRAADASVRTTRLELARIEQVQGPGWPQAPERMPTAWREVAEEECIMSADFIIMS
jgi:hypothetical protein